MRNGKLTLEEALAGVQPPVYTKDEWHRMAEASRAHMMEALDRTAQMVESATGTTHKSWPVRVTFQSFRYCDLEASDEP